MSDGALRFKVHASVREIGREAWTALLPPDATPFQDHTWFEALETAGCSTNARGWHPRHLGLYRGDRLVALAPAFQRDDSHGEFVFDWAWARAAQNAGVRYYPKLVLAVPFTPCTGPRIFTAPGENARAMQTELLTRAVRFARDEGMSSVHMLFPTAPEAEAAVDAGGFERLGVQFHWVNHGYKTYDDFLARFASKRRHQLRREAAAAQKQGITLRTRRGSELSGLDAGLVHRLYVSTVDRFVWGQRYLTPEFFRAVLTRFSHRVELVEALRGDAVVAGAFNVGDERVLYGRYWGCFEEHPFLHFNVCYYHSIAECIARGVTRFEGGAGGEHKLSRGFEPSVTRSAHWVFHRGLDRAVRDFAAREGAAIMAELPALGEASGLRRGTGDDPEMG